MRGGGFSAVESNGKKEGDVKSFVAISRDAVLSL
jgi:hypothetical protein